jgi:hypothetical protein
MKIKKTINKLSPLYAFATVRANIYFQYLVLEYQVNLDNLFKIQIKRKKINVYAKNRRIDL